MTAGRIALAALLTGCGLTPVSAGSQPATAEARQVAAMTDQLPPPAPLAPGTVAAAQAPRGETPASNLRRADFLRAFWLDAADPAIQSPEAIRKTVADCRAAGFNTICALVRNSGTAAYATELTPRATTVPAGFDPLAALLTEARTGAKPLRVLAWMKMAEVGSPAGRDPRAHVASLHPEWLSAGQKSPALWLDPAAAGARQHLAAVASDLAARYAVDGVVLDECGYAPTLDTGYNPAVVQRYQIETKTSAAPAPADASWIQWRRTQAAECVAHVRQAIRAARPQATVTLVSRVNGLAPADRVEYLNTLPALERPLDVWPVLAENGAVDAVLLAAPQGTSVAGEASALESWSRFALENRGSARVITGVQARTKDAKYTAAMMLDPILEPLAGGVAVLAGAESPSKMDTSVFQQMFDPTLVEAHAQRLVASKTAGRAQSAGMLQLSGKGRLTHPAAPAPVSGGVYLQGPDPAALPPLATPAPIGPGAASLPPLPAPDVSATPPPAAPAPTPAIPSVAPAPNAPDVPSLPPAAPPPLPEPPALPPADAAAGVPSSLAAEAPAAAAELPPLTALEAPPVAPAAMLPPLAPIEGAPGAPAAPATAPSGGTISLNENTNFTGAPIVGGPPARVMPTITPPTIRPPARQVVGAEALPPSERTALAAPRFAIPDFSEHDSIFVPRTAPPVMRNYAPPAQRPTDFSGAGAPTQLETIVMRTGKEFTGQVLEHGPMIRVQMTNGGIIALDASRVAEIRPVTAAPSVAVPLSPEPIVLPPM